jgi:hypothetical protein
MSGVIKRSFHEPQYHRLGLLPPVCEILLQAASGRSNGLGTERTLVALTVSLTWSL